MRPDVIVVGAGVIGSSIAYRLASRRVRVLVLDMAAPATAPAASWASAGGVRRQGRDTREWALAQEAARRWPSLAEELGADVEFRQGGHLHVALGEGDARALDERVRRERAAGLEVAFVERARVRDLAPDITPRALAGAYSPGDGQANPVKTTRAFAAAASARGAAMRAPAAAARLTRAGARIAGVASGVESWSAEWVVLAAGAWSARLAEDAGVLLPIVPRAPQMILTDCAPPVLEPTVTAASRPLSLKQLPTGAFFIGGGWPSDVDRTRMTCRVREESVRGSWRVAAEVFPPVAGRRIQTAWCGLEGQSVDGVPFIGPVPGVEGLYVAAGFSGHGFQLSPAVGEAVADALTGRAAPALEPLTPARIEGFDAAAVRAFMADGEGESPAGTLG